MKDGAPKHGGSYGLLPFTVCPNGESRLGQVETWFV